MSHENQRLEDGFPIEKIHWNYDQDAIVTTRIIPSIPRESRKKTLYLPRLHPGAVNRERETLHTFLVWKWRTILGDVRSLS